MKKRCPSLLYLVMILVLIAGMNTACNKRPTSEGEAVPEPDTTQPPHYTTTSYKGRTNFYYMDSPDMYVEDDSITVSQHGPDSIIVTTSNILNDRPPFERITWLFTQTDTSNSIGVGDFRYFDITGDSLKVDGKIFLGSRYSNRFFNFRGKK